MHELDKLSSTYREASPTAQLLTCSWPWRACLIASEQLVGAWVEHSVFAMASSPSPRQGLLNRQELLGHLY